MRRGTHSARGRDAARADQRLRLGGKSAPELSLQGAEALSRSTPAAEGSEHKRELPAGGRGLWQRQLRTQEAEWHWGSPYHQEWTLFWELSRQKLSLKNHCKEWALPERAPTAGGWGGHG